jgi:tetraacyldisaccharide-1-P 4'-kinase
MLMARADTAGLVLMTTDKDHVRLAGDAALAKLAAQASVLPVRLVVDEQDQFRQLVLGAVGRT